MRRAVGDRAESSEIARRRGPFRRLDRSRAGSWYRRCADAGRHGSGAPRWLRLAERLLAHQSQHSDASWPGLQLPAGPVAWRHGGRAVLVWATGQRAGHPAAERSRELSLGGCPPAKTCSVAEVEPATGGTASAGAVAKKAVAKNGYSSPGIRCATRCSSAPSAQEAARSYMGWSLLLCMRTSSAMCGVSPPTAMKTLAAWALRRSSASRAACLRSRPTSWDCLWKAMMAKMAVMIAPAARTPVATAVNCVAVSR